MSKQIEMTPDERLYAKDLIERDACSRPHFYAQPGLEYRMFLLGGWGEWSTFEGVVPFMKPDDRVEIRVMP